MSGLQRGLLVALVAALVTGAVLALAVVLTGELGSTGGKVLGTTMALAAASITGMAAAAAPAGLRALTTVGLVASAVAFTLIAWFIWVDDGFDTRTLTLAKLLAVSSIGAVACAHAALLLRGRGRGDATDMVVTGTLVCTGAVSILLTTMIVGEWYADGMARLVAALAILAVLGTMLTPLLPRILGTPRRPGTE